MELILGFNYTTREFFPLRSELSELARQINSPMRSSDDLTIFKLEQKFRSTKVKLCQSSRLSYLNLLDWENKKFDGLSSFSSVVQPLVPLYLCHKAIQHLEKSIFLRTVSEFVVHLDVMSRNAENAPALSRRLERLIKCIKTVDSHLVVELFNTIIGYYSNCTEQHNVELFLSFLKHTCFSLEMKLFTMKQVFVYYLNSNYARKVLDFAREQRFDFWGIWEKKSNFSTIKFCPVTYAFFSRRTTHLQNFLDYGFRQNHHRRSTINDMLRFPVGLENQDGLKDILSDDSRIAIISEMRLFLTVSGLTSRMQEEHVECLRLVWSTRKDPFVTRQELINAFDINIGKLGNGPAISTRSRSDFLTKLDDCQTMLADYEWEKRQPRSLQHLCRCTIRETLNDNWELPHGVEKLPVPKKLKSYILLKLPS